MSESECFVAITNIPHDFHSADLRSYFSSFVESGAFVCFHFRHRPEKDESTGDTVVLTENVSSLSSSFASSTSTTSSTSTSTTSTSNNKATNNLISSSVAPSKWKSSKCCCCVVKLKCSRLDEFEQKYNNEHWTDVSNNYSVERCRISIMNISKASNQSSSSVCDKEEESDCIDEKTLLAMPEFKPPELMPNGNVGTPTLVFLDYIQRCLLPDRLINTLKLKFPTTERKRIYSTVRFQYDEREQACRLKKSYHYRKLKSKDTNTSRNHTHNYNETDQIADSDSRASSMNSISGDKKGDHRDEGISDGNLLSNDESNQKECLTKRDLKRLKKSERQEMLSLMNEGIEEHLIEVERKYHNDEDAEEWDRHEAVENDPSNQERNKERLYEEEIEQPWEKGGPGLVFYTDEIYWRAQEGDFDEQTTDDLDVDFSPYEGDGPGDKDIQDFLKIRQEGRFRSGYDKTDRFSIGLSSKPVNSKSESQASKYPSHLFRQPTHKIGQFDAHTKGIGRKVLEKQGWTDGHGLGKSQSGIKQALKGEGQKPRNKKGLGFVAPKPVRFGACNIMKQTRRVRQHLITTAKDDPGLTDPKEKFLQRQEPTTLKHRKTTIDQFHPKD